jgi:peptidoglycan/LPS O-acetylase OafA/YrhL
MSVTPARCQFVDWMKAAGIGVIVYGHVAHATTVSLTPPIYLKQLGVAFFLFATGFTLARERRRTAEVLINRLFQIYLFGVPLAAIITIAGLLAGPGPALSNYLPFAGGANVAFDNFPANPTTWYIGTYLHFLVLWALWLRRVRIRLWMVALALLLEMPVRALLIVYAGPFVAYMFLTNWIAVFLFGLERGAHRDQRAGLGVGLAGLMLIGGAWWAVAVRDVWFAPDFPFMTVIGWPVLSGAAMVSAGVSLFYIAGAGLLFELTRRHEAPAPVRFLARNSLIIFLAHMPLFFLLNPALVAWNLGYWTRTVVHLVICLPVLALVSEAIVWRVDPARLRARALAGAAALTPRIARPAPTVTWSDR